MGLDMYANFLTEEQVAKRNDPENDEYIEEDFYWRKHRLLHKWMENLYYSKGGEAESFNCVDVELTEEDLDCLERDIDEGDLPDEHGFFWGTESLEDYKNPDFGYYTRDKEFIAGARDALAEGKRVIYSSWW